MKFYLRRRSAFWIWRHRSWESLVGIRHSPTFLRIFICRTNGVVSLQWKGALVTEYGEDYSPFFQPSLRCYGPERRVGTNMTRVTEEKGLFSRSPQILYRSWNIIHHSNVKWISWYRFFLFATYVSLTYLLSVQRHTQIKARARERMRSCVRDTHTHTHTQLSKHQLVTMHQKTGPLIIWSYYANSLYLSLSLYPSVSLSLCVSLSVHPYLFTHRQLAPSFDHHIKVPYPFVHRRW